MQLSQRYQDVALVKYPEGGYLRVVSCKVETGKPIKVEASAAGDTFQTLAMLTRYGAPDTWFQIGDRDFATHIERTRRRQAGEPLSAVTAALKRMTCDRRFEQRVAHDSDRPRNSGSFQHGYVRVDERTYFGRSDSAHSAPSGLIRGTT